MKKALIFQGGWQGHEPELVSQRFADILKKEDFSVTISDTVDCLTEMDLKSLDLIVPVWTMGEISNEQCEAVSEAVAAGTGIAGCHGGMCDSFRQSVNWQFITGGQWISHPGGNQIKYTVNIKNSSSSIVDGIKDFDIVSEHYYLHVDPAVEVLATTRFPSVNWYHSSNKEVDMPVLWTKRWGHGRVFYSSLGHINSVFDIPEALETMKRGLLWAAEGKSIAVRDNLSVDDFKSDKVMF